MDTQTEEQAERRGSRRTLIGTVTSDKMQKTVVVQVSRRVKSGAYKKYLTKRVKYKAHTEKNEFHLGDIVEIVESRSLWRVSRLVEKAKQA